MTLTHAPVPAAQVLHTPEHAPAQQMPSSQTPLAHVAAPPGHAPPALTVHAPAALQVLAPLHVSGSSAFVTLVHTPVTGAQARQVPEHAAEQHTPSAQKPLAHVPAPPGQELPVLSLHVPAASQLLVPVQVSGSCALVTATHAPVPATQVMQVPEHGPPQQMPSSQTPDRQPPPFAHGPPNLALHAPAALQVFAPVHVSGSSALMTATHAPVPTAHVLQVPEQAPEQHTPSSQAPLEQVAAPPGHGLPALTLHAPAASHALVPAHVS
jgi:hypothetical protein